MFKLDSAGIECKIHYDYALSPVATESNTNKFISRSLSLPIYAELTDSEVEFITKEVMKGI